jgi:hypothetical protein
MTTGGKCNIAMKKYLSIGKFLENHNAKFYDVLDCLEMNGALHPRMGKSITFLNPDKKYVDEIIKKASGDDPEEAVEMVQSLILQGEYKTGADFEKFKSDIPTLYGSKLVVKSVKGDTVEIDGGSLTLNKTFKPYTRSRKGLTTTMVVWDLSGHVEFKSAPAADYSNLKKNHDSRAKKGGNEVSAADIADDLSAYSRDNNGKVIKRLNQWATYASGDEKTKRTFQYIGTKSPLIDYLLIFCSGVFGALAADTETKDGAYADLFSDMPNSIDKSDQHFTACVGVNKGNSKKIGDLYKSFDSDLKDTLINGTDLYNLHAFIYYAYNVLKCGQDDSSVNANDMIIGCAKDCCGCRIRANGAKMLEPSAFGLSSAVDMSGYYQDFLAKVAFRAPVSSDVVNTVEGAGEDDDDDDDDDHEDVYSDFNDVMEDSGSFKMSESAMRELRNYMAAHGKCPLA